MDIQKEKWQPRGEEMLAHEMGNKLKGIQSRHQATDDMRAPSPGPPPASSRDARPVTQLSRRFENHTYQLEYKNI